MLSRRAPQRRHSLRWHGKTLKVYRATQEAVRSTWRRDGLSVEALEEAAEEALGWLAGIELRHSIAKSRMFG